MGLIQEIPVRLGARAYTIVIGSEYLSTLGSRIRSLELGTDAVLLSNRTIFRAHGKLVTASLKKAGFAVHPLTVPDSERSKSLAVLGRLLTELARLQKPGRRLFLVLLGGGVIGDLGGVAAGLYRRGIPCVQLPTTLLAQVDSSIGGKTAVDLPQGKNLIGLFYQPRLVFEEISFLRTLPDRQVRSGLAEIIKCGVIRDALLFERLEQETIASLRADEKTLAWVIARAAAVKARMVERDEYEKKGIRTILNFGHTVGHALETAGGYTGLAHGEAVALGMRVASEIARRMKVISKQDADRINSLINRFGLPGHIHGVKWDRVWTAMAHDKKWVRSSNRWVLPSGIGRCTVREGIPEPVIRAAIRTYWEE